MRELSRTHRVPLALAAVLLLTGCPNDLTVSVQEGSTIDQLTFVVNGSGNGPEEVPMFFVESCAATYGGDADVYWHFEADSDPRPIHELQYGQVAYGYRTRTQARPLRVAGCYTVAYGGREALYFTVSRDGRAIEIGQAQAKSLADK